MITDRVYRWLVFANNMYKQTIMLFFLSITYIFFVVLIYVKLQVVNTSKIVWEKSIIYICIIFPLRSIHTFLHVKYVSLLHMIIMHLSFPVKSPICVFNKCKYNFPWSSTALVLIFFIMQMSESTYYFLSNYFFYILFIYDLLNARLTNKEKTVVNWND